LFNSFAKNNTKRENTMAPPPVIDLQQISKLYRLGSTIIQALAGVDMTVQSGEYVSIMGPSGSGKSTLMNIIGCLDTPTQGCYRLDGIDVAKQSEAKLAEMRGKKIGFVFQTFNLLSRMSALDNVALPLIYSGVRRKDRVKRAEQALAEVELNHRCHHRPNELSGGERQRVAIARALCAQPSLLLADEPTGNLDSKVGEEILQLFDRLHQRNVTIILVTHDAEVALRARRSVKLRDGLKVHDDLVANTQFRSVLNKETEAPNGDEQEPLRQAQQQENGAAAQSSGSDLPASE
jgi:putative ABC transport system ATP-binding protein